MSDKEIKELCNKYAEENAVDESDKDRLTKAYSDGIHKGIEIVLNTLDSSKNMIVELMTKTVLNTLRNTGD